MAEEVSGGYTLYLEPSGGKGYNWDYEFPQFLAILRGCFGFCARGVVLVAFSNYPIAVAADYPVVCSGMGQSLVYKDIRYVGRISLSTHYHHFRFLQSSISATERHVPCMQ